MKKILSGLVAFSIWALPLAAMSGSAYGQTSSSSSSKNSKKESTAKTSPTPNPNSTLSVKENPAMIGKRNINSGTDKFFGWLGGSQDKEMQIGRQLSLEIEQQIKLVEDPMVTEYVNRVGQNIVLHSDAKVPFTIKVIDSDEVNAFALPGGYFYVNRGLILAADNESELAGVMAHEIAHVAARHAMENQGKGSLIQFGLIAGILMTGGVAGGILQNTAGLTQLLAFFKFSRSAEEEADRLGVQYLYAAGYDPRGMATMFEKLASQNKKKPGTLSKLFTSHPQSLDRKEASDNLVARFPERPEYIISTSEFQRVKSHLMRMTNARAGVLVDFDDPEDAKPTLKKRQPDATIDDPSVGAPSTSDAPPVLRKRGQPDPTPQPSPTN